MLAYQREKNLGIEEFTEVLVSSTLGERRPVDEPDRIAKMLEYGNLIITARFNGKLVGVARSLTDFSIAHTCQTWLLTRNFRNKELAKELIRLTKSETPKAKLILLAAPKAVGYYPKIGMTRHENCYFLDNIDDMK